MTASILPTYATRSNASIPLRRQGEQFLADAMIQDAVIRNLEVIGEAVKGLSESLRLANPDVPWKQIAGMRDVLIHHYFGVKLETVWQVVADHLPQLRDRVEQLLK